MSSVPDTPARTVAVVGGGPRGISVVERLIANAPVLGGERLEIILIEPYRPGGGRIWPTDQPSHLLMNTLCADATHFTDETVEIEGPVQPGPTLYDWSVAVRDGGITDLGHLSSPIDADLLDEVQEIEPHSHPSRRLLGAYLEWCHARDIAAAGDLIAVRTVRGFVQRLMPRGDGWSLDVVATVLPTDPGVCPDAPTQRVDAEAVVLATGHSDTEPTARQVELELHARAHGLYFGLPTNPITQHGLGELSAGEPVIVRGLGMNFFDYMSLLTLGRGGRFVEDPDGPDALRYKPSGEEPILLAGSGRGVPYRAKGRFRRMTPSFPRRYFTTEIMQRLQADVEAGRQIDFLEQMYPLIMKDGAYIYYATLAENDPDVFAGEPASIVSALDELTWGSVELDAAIADVVPHHADRLDVRALDRPLDGKEFTRPEDLAEWWIADMRHDLREANRGMHSALKCASVQIGAGRAPLRTLVRYGGLRGQSYARDAEGWFRGLGGMLASGPPARRIEELVALVRAGVVVPVGARMTVDASEGQFTTASASVPGHVHRARALLEAHLPPANFPRTANPALRNLREEGLARPFTIPDLAHEPFVSGALEVGPPPYRVVDADGGEHRSLYAVGVPLESILWGTQLQPLACTNSRMLRETDAVARDALMPGIDAVLAEDEVIGEAEANEEAA